MGSETMMWNVAWGVVIGQSIFAIISVSIGVLCRALLSDDPIARHTARAILKTIGKRIVQGVVLITALAALVSVYGH